MTTTRSNRASPKAPSPSLHCSPATSSTCFEAPPRSVAISYADGPLDVCTTAPVTRVCHSRKRRGGCSQGPSDGPALLPSVDQRAGPSRRPAPRGAAACAPPPPTCAGCRRRRRFGCQWSPLRRGRNVRQVDGRHDGMFAETRNQRANEQLGDPGGWNACLLVVWNRLPRERSPQLCRGEARTATPGVDASSSS